MMALVDDLDPIFADCVDLLGQRNLRQPWVRDGFVYASDGRIIVRQPTTLLNSTHDAPDAHHILEEAVPTDEVLSVPDIGPEKAEYFECPHCSGLIPRQREVVVLCLGLLLADHYVWLLRRHRIVEARAESNRDMPAICFRKGDITGIVLGMQLGPQNPRACDA